jgi:hypothetical protein
MRPVSQYFFITNAVFSQSYNAAVAQRTELTVRNEPWRLAPGVWRTLDTLRASIVSIVVYVQTPWAKNTL